LFANLDENDLRKVCVVNGDVTSEKLGLSIEDYKLVTAEINLVFHAAARVFFNASLKSAVTSNLIGSKHILDFCHQIKHLAVYQKINSFVKKYTAIISFFRALFMCPLHTQIAL
jgi:thioester reductase-like protein